MKVTWLMPALFLVACGSETEVDVRQVLNVPPHFATPSVPEVNPVTPEKIELGRHLFYDEQLSGNGTTSCASCHEQQLAFADGKVRPTGSTGQVHPRNSQGLANVAYASTLTWANNALPTLEEQIQIPIRADNPVELGVNDGNRQEVLQRFAIDLNYQRMFIAAFGDDEVTINRIVFALASFCRSMISGNSPFDRFLQGDQSALTEQQQLGLRLFNSERFECFHCHSGTQLTVAYRDARTQDSTFANPFFNNGLYNVDGDGSYPAHDQGLYDLTFNPDHRGLFRPQSLRNVALTAPYMHDGSIETLEGVIAHYAAGGTNTTEGPFAGDGRISPLKSGLIRGFQATDEEIAAVVAFLESLTDDDFIRNPAFAKPEL